MFTVSKYIPRSRSVATSETYVYWQCKRHSWMIREYHKNIKVKTIPLSDKIVWKDLNIWKISEQFQCTKWQFRSKRPRNQNITMTYKFIVWKITHASVIIPVTRSWRCFMVTVVQWRNYLLPLVFNYIGMYVILMQLTLFLIDYNV